MLGLVVIVILIGAIVSDELDRRRRVKAVVDQYERDCARWRGL